MSARSPRLWRSPTPATARPALRGFAALVPGVEASPDAPPPQVSPLNLTSFPNPPPPADSASVLIGQQRFGSYVLARLPCPTLTTFTVSGAVRFTGFCAIEAHWMGFIFIAADWFGHTVVLSGEASRPASVTGPFDRESLNSVEQTFTGRSLTPSAQAEREWFLIT